MQRTFAKLSAILISALALPAQAQTPQELFELGMRSYKNADYEAAAKYFEDSAQNGGGAAAHFNAGNAHAKMKKPGLAILSYERARYLNPRSPEAPANISAVSKSIGIPEGKSGLADSFFGELSNSEWIIAASCGFWIFTLSALLPVFLRKRNCAFKIAAVLGGGIFCVAVAGTIYWSQMRNTAISISQDAVLKLSPAKNAPAIAAFPEGRRAIIKERKGGYLRLYTPDKKSGWASLENVKPVRP
ncbi:MAG: hypothetical protein IKO42_01505 [Opitutales bacterium]|nr:hypothetical protein [Opitutales bacterium]